MTEKQELMAKEEICIDQAEVMLCSQEDLRAASYALYLAEENETEENKRKSLKNVQDALWAITNFFGTDAIGSREVLQKYYPNKFKEPS